MSEIEKTTENAAEAAAETVKEAAAEEKTGKGRKKKEKVKKSVGMEILSWVLTLLVAVLVALVIRSVIFEPVRVDGHSMDDTLADREIMFVSKFDYSSVWLSFPWQSNEAKENAARINLFGNPNRFDVVICRYPGRGDTNFVKRVIGLPGDTVKLENGRLSVNGTEYDEPYVNDEYRSGGLNDLDDYVVPKKGDTFSVRFDGNSYSVFLNGEQWRISNTVMKCRDADGKRLTISKGGQAIEYDGKKYSLNYTDGSSELIEMLTSISDRDFTVDEDYYFVMGDHRNNSNDSRSQGAIERSMIIGHVRQVVFPFSQWRGVPNGLDVK